MPDALPPVGVLLATLDAATLPLAGTETTFVMQGGQPRRTPVSSIGGGSGYSTSSTYTPTLTPMDAGILEPDTYPWGWSRVGPGPGPQPGDTVTVYGALFAGTNAEGPTAGGGVVSLPFVPEPFGPTSTHASSGHVDTAVNARALVHPAFGLVLLALDVTEAGGPVRTQITSTYRTANAVDP